MESLKGKYVTVERSTRGDGSYSGNTLQVAAVSGNYVTLTQLKNQWGLDERDKGPLLLDMREWPLVELSDDHLRAVGIIPTEQTLDEQLNALDAEIVNLTEILNKMTP